MGVLMAVYPVGLENGVLKMLLNHNTLLRMMKKEFWY